MKLNLIFLLSGTVILAQPVSKISLADGIDNIPPAARKLFLRLATNEISFQSDLVLELAKIDGITPPLMELLKKLYDSPPTDEDIEFNIFLALKNRRDLKEADIAWLRERLNEQWNKPHGTFIAAFKQESLWLLGFYPSPDNEEMLIKHLQEDKAVGFSYAAVDSLALIGTKKALPALEVYKKTLDERATEFKITAQAIDAIKARSSQQLNSSRDGSTGNEASPTRLKLTDKSQSNSSISAHESTSQSWITWLLCGIIATIVAIWLIQKKWK